MVTESLPSRLRRWTDRSARMLRGRGILAAIRFVLALVFIYAGAMKLIDPGTFALAIDSFGLVPWRTARVLSVALPVLEVAGGLGLACNLRGALSLVAGQLLLFMAVLGYGVLGGLEADCGCFGLDGTAPVGTEELKAAMLRDAFMLGGCLWLHVGRRRAGASGRP